MPYEHRNVTNGLDDVADTLLRTILPEVLGHFISHPKFKNFFNEAHKLVLSERFQYVNDFCREFIRNPDMPIDARMKLSDLLGIKLVDDSKYPEAEAGEENV